MVICQISEESDVEEFINRYKDSKPQLTLLEKIKKLDDVTMLLSYKLNNINKFNLARLVKLFMSEINTKNLELDAGYVADQSIDVIMSYRQKDCFESYSEKTYEVTLHVPEVHKAIYWGLISKFNTL